MTFERITESTSKYRHLEKMTVSELLNNINKEDRTVAEAVEKLKQVALTLTQRSYLVSLKRDLEKKCQS